MQVYCIDANTISKQTKNEISHDPHHLGVPSGASKMISEPMVHLAQTMHLSLTNTNTVSKQKRNGIPHDPHHLGVPSGVSKMNSVPMVRSMQTVHLSCVNITTISKCTKMSFRLSLVTYEYHQVHPKRFSEVWYVWHKPCSYLGPTLTLSPSGPK